MKGEKMNDIDGKFFGRIENVTYHDIWSKLIELTNSITVLELRMLGLEQKLDALHIIQKE